MSASYFSVGTVIDTLGFGPYQIFLTFLVGMAMIADAMEMMILSVLAPALHCHWQITQYQQASLTTVVFLGKKIVEIELFVQGTVDLKKGTGCTIVTLTALQGVYKRFAN